MKKYSRQSMASIFLACLFLLMASGSLASPPGHVVADSPDTNQIKDHTLGMLMGGTIVGSAGFFSGALIGASMSDGGSEFAGIEEALVVGSICGGLALPIGVHAGNRKQGDLSKVMATSIAVGGLGWIFMWQTDNAYLLVGLPLVQLVACMSVEYATTPSTQSAQTMQQASEKATPAIQVNLVPSRDGMGLFFSGTF